jgi:hypothetical protein
LYSRNLLISEDLHKILEYSPDFQRELIGETELKGKEHKLNIYSIELTKTHDAKLPASSR